jgi:hypothetical protein
MGFKKDPHRNSKQAGARFVRHVIIPGERAQPPLYRQCECRLRELHQGKFYTTRQICQYGAAPDAPIAPPVGVSSKGEAVNPLTIETDVRANLCAAERRLAEMGYALGFDGADHLSFRSIRAKPLSLSDFLNDNPGLDLRALIERCDLPLWSNNVVTTGADHFILV